MMEWTTQGFAAVLVAMTGAAAAIFAGIRNLRGDRFKQEVETSAALLTGYKDMVMSLREELDAVRGALVEERGNWARERGNWARERQELHVEIDDLRERLEDLMRRLSDRHTRQDPLP